jgi:hypothetical protein
MAYKKTDLAAEAEPQNRSFCKTEEGYVPQRHTTTARAKHRGFEGKGVRVAPDLRRQLGISERTYFRWKAKYGGIETRGAKKLKLEDENPKLKQLRPN